MLREVTLGLTAAALLAGCLAGPTVRAIQPPSSGAAGSTGAPGGPPEPVAGPLPYPSPAAPTPADGVAAYYRGDLNAAAAAYLSVLSREPENVAARRDLIQVLREAGRLPEALGQLDALLSRWPRDGGARLAAAETALFAGQPERTLRYLGREAEAAERAGSASGPGAREEPGEAAEASPGESLYLAALALMDLGRQAEAAEALSASLGYERFNPWGWFWLGILHWDLGAPGQAEAELLEALSQDRNLTRAFLPLARIYLADGRIEKAYGLLGRAAGSLPGDSEVAAALEELRAAHPELSERAEEERRLKREGLSAKRAESFPPDRESLPTVRVGLAEGVQELYLKTGGDWLLTGVGLPAREGGAGEPGADGASAVGNGAGGAGKAGTVLQVRLAEGSLEVIDPGGSLLVRSAGAVRLAYPDPADTTILFDVQYGLSSFWAGSEDRMYRGVIEMVPHPEGFTVINELSIEEYLYSVLPSEMPSSWPAAALEAQAVAARSYTLANLGRFAARGFDLLGTVASAAYRGMGSENAAARAAVDGTRGLVLTEPAHPGEPLSAFYSANCGGYTETTEYVWGFASSLPAVPDLLLPPHPGAMSPAELARFVTERPVTFSAHPGFANRSAYRWVLWVPRRDIEARLGLGESLGSVLGIAATARGSSGRIPEVRILGSAGETTIRWDAIRWKLGGLRSNLFVVVPKLGRDGLPEYFVFTGAGWGHGVGMCQTGAAGMASVGFDARAILEHYYRGEELVPLY